MDLINNFKTPQEFIDYYYNKIQEDLNTYNIQINKVGVIGFFINLLGNTNFDVKQYFDSLFTEAFVATARQDRNLLLHSAIYGVDVNFANAATATGIINFNYRNLPTKTSDIVKREVILGDLENGIEFQVDDFKFKSISQYVFIEETLEDGSTQYRCNIKTPRSSKNVPSTTYDIDADLVDTYQYYIKEYTTILSNYVYLTYENYSISLPDDDQIYDLEVYVKTRDSDVYEQYEVKTSKHFEGENDKTVFYRIFNSNVIQIEFGNGIRGKYVPEAEVRIVVKLTRGNTGNLPRTTNCTLSSDLHAKVIYYRADNTVYAPQSYEVSNLFNITLESSIGGCDMPIGDELRNNILKYVRSRDNFISEEDFYDIASKYSNNFKFLFRKIGISENVFYLLQSFRDKYKNIVKTTNLTIDKFNPLDIHITNVNHEIDYTMGNLNSGGYRYAIVGTDGFSYTEPYEFSVNFEVDFATVTITWDKIEKCNSYLVYRQTSSENSYSRYFKVYDTRFIDDGYRTDDTEVSGISTLGNVVFPTFMYSGTEVVSPFMYIYDKNMKWWDGYLIYPNNIEYFNKIDIPDDSVYDVPITYLNIIYSYGNQNTKIQVKSYQDISEYKFYLTIEKLNMYDIELDNVDQNTFEYIYNLDYGILFDPTIMIIKCVNSSEEFVFTGTTSYIYQCYNISDTLRLFEYIINNSKQIINIPVIDKDVFETDVIYYLDSIYNFIKGFEFSENRMISDNIQTRFLNSIFIDKLYVKNMTIQKYDFDINLPLRMNIELILDKEYITLNGISVSSELDTILLEVTSELNEKYTGTNISFYNSKIVDLIHDNNDRDKWIKSVKINIYDSIGTLIDGGIETYTDDYEMFLKISSMKSELIKYTPPFWYWDLDNINTQIKYY